jgi:hypothetical protein
VPRGAQLLQVRLGPRQEVLLQEHDRRLVRGIWGSML